MASRLGNLVRGFFSIFVSGLERKNPEALLEVEQENLRRQVGKFNVGLASHAGLVERLIGQVRKLESDEVDLRSKTAANVKLGNRAAAGQYALRLQTVERELAENRKQVDQAEVTYKELIRARDVAVGIARTKIENLKGGISDLKMKRAMAEMTEMAGGMVTQLGGSGDTLNRLESMVRGRALQGRRPRARGRRLARHERRAHQAKPSRTRWPRTRWRSSKLNMRRPISRPARQKFPTRKPCAAPKSTAAANSRLPN